MIELRDLRKVFPGSANGETVTAVDGVSLQVERGETLCLVGTSGCGKTTTLKMINRLIEPTAGTVTVGGEDVASLDVVRLRRSIGYVVQSGGLFPHMTVAANVGLLCELEGWKAARREARVSELLELVNLAPATFASRYPRELSGGQRQRVGVARALALDPDYVLMDEPFGALDPITRRELHEEFRRLDTVAAKTVVLVTHDIAEACALGDRIALMHAGRVVQVGTERELRDKPANELVTGFFAHNEGNGALA